MHVHTHTHTPLPPLSLLSVITEMKLTHFLAISFTVALPRLFSCAQEVEFSKTIKLPKKGDKRGVTG